MGGQPSRHYKGHLCCSFPPLTWQLAESTSLSPSFSQTTSSLLVPGSRNPCTYLFSATVSVVSYLFKVRALNYLSILCYVSVIRNIEEQSLSHIVYNLRIAQETFNSRNSTAARLLLKILSSKLQSERTNIQCSEFDVTLHCHHLDHNRATL